MNPSPDGASTSSDRTRPFIAGVVPNDNYGDFVLDAVASLQARVFPSPRSSSSMTGLPMSRESF